MRKLTVALTVLAIAVFAATGCGSEEQAASAASELVPAGAVLYGEANLKPEGDQKEAIDAIVAKFPGGGEAGAALQELIEKGLRESDAPISYEQDIKPWLGDEAAFFASGVGRDGELRAAAGLVATEDEEAALAALERSAEGEITRKTYKDVEYMVDSESAAAVFDGFVVLGTEAGVKAAIGAAEDGSPLSDDEAYKAALEDAAEDRLGLFYVNSPELLRAGGQGAMALPEAFRKFFEEPFVATVDAEEDGVVFEATIPEDLAKTLGFLGQGSDLQAELPADSWLAMAQTDFGNLLDFWVDAFGSAVGGRDAVERQFQAATGLDLQRDVLDWMGDFAVFVRGTTVPELNGALIVETNDEAASGRFLAALERLARAEGGVQIGPLSAPGGGEGFTVEGEGIPKPVHIFQRDGRVVFAYGDEAAADAIAPGETLGDSAEYAETLESLGDYEVSFYLLLQPIFDLVDSTEAGSYPEWQRAKPYLEPLSALVAGTSGDGDELRSATKVIVE